MNKYRDLTVPEETLKFATKFIGLLEWPGNRHNPDILQMSKSTGMKWVKDDETPWCSIAINYIAFMLNLERSKKPNARSWLEVGMEIKNPLPGDIVIFWRGDKNGWQGHVAIFTGYAANGNVFSLGGNQGNEFDISEYKTDRILGFRRLKRL